MMAVGMMAFAADREILLIAGKASHGPGDHEQNAGALLLAKWLNRVPGIHATVSLSGWPADRAVVDRADSIYISCDGGRTHLAFVEGHEVALRAAMARGAGLVLLHYAVMPDGPNLAKTIEWMGGAYEVSYSVNPFWDADYKSFPVHPVTRGVKPFQIRDEWYFNMRFVAPTPRLVPILVALPPDKVFLGPDGLHSGNPDVRKKVGTPQCTAWAYERPNGGRSFGFTGGHPHSNWGDGNFRKVVLNALVWTAKGEVPAGGVESVVRPEELRENLDPKKR